MQRGGLQTERDGTVLRLSLSGAWTLPSMADLAMQVTAVQAAGLRRAVIDTSRLDRLDTAGAVLLHRLWRRLSEQGAAVDWPQTPERYRRLLDYVAPCEALAPQPRPGSGLIGLIVYFGWLMEFFLREARRFVAFIGRVAESAVRTVVQLKHLRLTSMVYHMEETGLRAIPIVGLLSFLIGMVMAYQGASQLQRFGAEIFVVDLIGISVLRELGVLLTAILIAGRSGSAFTAQIGTMKVNEEIAAMRTLGLDPVIVLVLPRMFALIITLPLLTFFADIMGLLGGALMAWNSLHIDPFLFFQRLHDVITLRTFVVGMIKAPVFAALIALVGCYEGLRVKGDAASVGRLTTRSVVQSIFLVILFDALFSIMFNILNI
ncbi:MAG TPA: MlaE family lipid ABC transporter permease subunit [Ferrovibrio sp.]|uniref:ABC transporter permease n=1 Tax=Ferrovibrio sp. TaxID=1917215 RepID=UPI002ED50D54